jgi:hypothetical protein
MLHFRHNRTPLLQRACNVYETCIEHGFSTDKPNEERIEMPIYRVAIVGRKAPVLLKAESAAKAKDLIVTAESLTGEEMADALADGEKVWTPGTDLPADVKAGGE